MVVSLIHLLLVWSVPDPTHEVSMEKQKKVQVVQLLSGPIPRRSLVFWNQLILKYTFLKIGLVFGLLIDNIGITT